MLFIYRKNRESVFLGDGIEIKVLCKSSMDNPCECKHPCPPHSVKLGISAPKDIKILRNEIFSKTKKKNNEGLINGWR